jgi:FixJ family two-component response regulator
MLVADDEASIRSILRDLLEDEGYAVEGPNRERVFCPPSTGKNGPNTGSVVMDVRMPDRPASKFCASSPP